MAELNIQKTTIVAVYLIPSIIIMLPKQFTSFNEFTNITGVVEIVARKSESHLTKMKG